MQIRFGHATPVTTLAVTFAAYGTRGFVYHVPVGSLPPLPDTAARCYLFLITNTRAALPCQIRHLTCTLTIASYIPPADPD